MLIFDLPTPAAATLAAASLMEAATSKAKPLSLQNLAALGHVGALQADHQGHLEVRSFLAALTTPPANTSQRRMPPKMLIRMACTLGSVRIISKPLPIISSLAPPPTSRKLAALAPAMLTTSMVAMARPAPLTMVPTLPSRRM